MADKRCAWILYKYAIVARDTRNDIVGMRLPCRGKLTKYSAVHEPVQKGWPSTAQLRTPRVTEIFMTNYASE